MHQDTAGIGYDGEIYRKILHLLALLYPVLYLTLPNPWGISLLVGLSLTALFLDWLRAVNVPSHAFFDRFFGFMMRAQERDVLGENVVINGATWVTVAFTLLVLLFDTDVAVVSFATFMIGDAAAALIGRSLGRRSWLRQGATVEGSLAFLIVGSSMGWVLVSGLLPWPQLSLPFPAVFAATAVAAVLEAAPIPLNDNLSGPLGAALTITCIMASWPS
jgi:dolichol kinase